MRIVSLVPSLTETARAWGIDPIACTQYCEQPDLPTVGGTKNPAVEAIAELKPDLVMLDKVENRREDAEALAALGLELFVTDVCVLADVVRDLDLMAEVLGIECQTSDWPEFTAETFVPPTEIGRCFIPIWRRPWMTIGPQTFGASLLAAIGVGNAYSDATTDYPEVELSDVAARSVDLVLAPSEPYVYTPEHLRELEVVAPTIEVDGQDLFWWGVRTPVAIERLKAAIVPTLESAVS